MDNKEIFNKLLYCRCFPEKDLSISDNILKQTLEEIFDHYQNSNKTMKKLFETRYAWDVDAEIILLQNMFLGENQIEQKVRMKDKEKYKSILLWLMDNVGNNEADFNGMIGRAVGLFGSILGCIKTTKSKSGKFNHDIMSYDWETEY